MASVRSCNVHSFCPCGADQSGGNGSRLNGDSLEGLDIVLLHQAPAQHLLPDNVHFKYLDLQEDIPAEFVGRYDLGVLLLSRSLGVT